MLYYLFFNLFIFFILDSPESSTEENERESNVEPPRSQHGKDKKKQLLINTAEGALREEICV